MKYPHNLCIEIIAVGSELLTPYYQDSNSLFLTRHLNDLGLTIASKTIVGDDRAELEACFKQAVSRSDLIFTIGGLGPTQDDNTREAFAAALGKELVFQEDLMKNIESRFRRRGIAMAAVNRKQAFVIEGSEALANENGTAPGLWLEFQNKIIVLLPGPPHEIEPMFEQAVLPRLEKYRCGFVARRHLKIAGLTESKTESLISDLYPQDETKDLTILAYPGQIEIHITARSETSLEEARSAILPWERSLQERLSSHIFSSSGEELEEVVGRLLVQSQATLAVAESCTGGLLGHRITNIPGSSRYFLEGVQVYSNAAKVRHLHVSPEILEELGAVSAEAAKAMATGVREKSGADYGLAITGIAGPSGGTPEKPLGLVYNALAWEGGIRVIENRFLGTRLTIKTRSVQAALDMLRRRLLGLEENSRE